LSVIRTYSTPTHRIPYRANIIKSPTQYAIIWEAGPLQPLIEETYRWHGVADLAVAWESIEEELLKKRTDMIIEHSPDYWSLPSWQDSFGRARGPSLCRPLYPAAFSHRLIVAYRASDGFWCQGYRGGVPEARPIRLKRESRVGMAVIGAFDRKWFPSLPMIWAEPRLASPTLKKMEWHPDDDLLSSDLPLELELAKWL